MEARMLAHKFAVLECDFILDMIEGKLNNKCNLADRVDLYCSSALSVAKLWSWAVRSRHVEQFVAIVDALGRLQGLSKAICQHEGGHQKRELEQAERSLVQMLHFSNKDVREFHMCRLSFTDACCFNVDIAWRDTYDNCRVSDDSAVESIRYLYL
jgi:hypothetical protein